MSSRIYHHCNGAILLPLLFVMIMIISYVLFSPTDEKHHSILFDRWSTTNIPSIATIRVRGTRNRHLDGDSDDDVDLFGDDDMDQDERRILKQQKHCGLLSDKKCKSARHCEMLGQYCIWKLPTAENMNNYGVGGGGTGSGPVHNSIGAQCAGMTRTQCKKCEVCAWSSWNGLQETCVYSATGNDNLIPQQFSDSMSCSGMGMKGCKKSNACSWVQGICVHGTGFGDDSKPQQVSAMMSSSTQSCSQMKRMDCKRAKNCKFNRGKNGGSGSCINRGGRNNNGSAARPARDKRIAVQEESSTASTTTTDTKTDTPTQDYTQEVVQEEERPLKYWSRPMLSGSICIYSNTYPETYINVVGHLLLFDSKEECCIVYDCRSQEEEDIGTMANSISIDEDKP